MLKNKRSAFTVLMFAAIAAFIAYFCNFTVMFITVVLFLAAAVFAAIKNKPTVLLSLILGIAVLAQAAVIQFCAVNKLEYFNAKNVEICGTLCDTASAGKGYITQTVKVSSVDGVKFATPVKIKLIDFNGFVANQGDNICITAKLKTSKGTAYERTNFAQGIYATGSNIKVKYVVEGANIYTLSGRVKGFVKGTLEDFLPYNEASVLSAIVVGDRENIADNLYNAVVTSGVSHMLVVSGMHLSIICSVLIRLLHRFLSNRMAAVIAIPLVLFIAVVCDFGYSIMRAAISYAIFLVGSICLKRSDPLSSLCMSSVLILMYNPFALGSAALLLSVSSTAGIITVSVPMYDKLKQKLCKGKWSFLKIIIEPFCMTLGAMLFCLPVSMILFGRISLVSVITNVLVSYSITIALCITVAGLLLCIVVPFEPLLNIVFAVAGACIKYFCAVVRIMAGFRFASVSITEVYAVVCSVILVAAAILSAVLIKRGKVKKLICIFAAAIIPFTALSVYLNTSDVTITALKLKASQCVIINYNNTALVIGAGNNTADRNSINNALKELKVEEIAAVYIIDDKESKVGVTSLLENNKVKEVYSVQENKVSHTLPYGIKTTLLGEAAYVDLGGYALFVSEADKLTSTQNLYAKKADAYIYTENGETCVNKYKTDVSNIVLKIKQVYALRGK